MLPFRVKSAEEKMPARIGEKTDRTISGRFFTDRREPPVRRRVSASIGKRFLSKSLDKTNGR